jgi:hypothetical protein
MLFPKGGKGLKFFTKLNRGVLLTIAAVIAVAVYLIMLGAGRSAAKPEIERVCRSYTAAVSQQMLLPVKYRAEKPSVPAGELKACEDSAAAAVTAYYPSADLAKYEVSVIKKSLESQAAGSGTVYTFKRTIKSFDSVTFDGDTATVRFTSLLEYNGPLGGNTSGAAVTKTMSDVMMLKKTGGRWRVVYSNLQQIGSTGSAGVSSKE